MNKPNDGVIYTKKWVVRYMLDMAGYTIDKDLSGIKLVEPCCGEGSFATEIVERLCCSRAIKTASVSRLEKALLFFEIDSEALKKTKESVRSILLNSFTASKTEKLLKAWFVERDYIDSDLTGIDLVIGNPPYIRACELPEDQRRHYTEKLTTFSKGCDIYIAFFENALRSLSETGKLIFICSDRWQKNQFGKKLRDLIDTDYYIALNVSMHDVDVFENEVTAYPSITMITREKTKLVDIKCADSFTEDDVKTLEEASKANYICPNSCPFVVFNEPVATYSRELPFLKDSGIQLGIGVATGLDRVFLVRDPEIVESERLLPLAYSKDLVDGHFQGHTTCWMVNPWNGNDLVELDKYPEFKKYMTEHEAELKKRNIAQSHPDKWYRTIDRVIPGLKSKKKLLIRDIGRRVEPIYDDGELYPHHNFYWITSDEWDLRLLGGLLMSDRVEEMMDKLSVKMRGGMQRNQAQYLRRIRLPYLKDITSLEANKLKKAFDDRDYSSASELSERIYKRYE